MIRQFRFRTSLLLAGFAVGLAALVAVCLLRLNFHRLPPHSDLHHLAPYSEFHLQTQADKLNEDYDAVENDVIENFHQYFPRTDWETDAQFWKDKPYLPGDTLPGFGYRAMGSGREYILEVKNGTNAAGAKQVAVYAHTHWEQVRMKYMDVSAAHHFMVVVVNENYTVLARLGKKQKGQDVY